MAFTTDQFSGGLVQQSHSAPTALPGLLKWSVKNVQYMQLNWYSLYDLRQSDIPELLKDVLPRGGPRL